MNLTLPFYKNVGEMHSPLSASFITTTFLRLNGVNTSTIDLISNIGNSLSSRKLYCPNSQLDQDHLLAEIDKFVVLKILRVDTTTWKNLNLPLIVHPFQCQAAPELSSWFFPAEEVLLPAKQHKSASALEKCIQHSHFPAFKHEAKCSEICFPTFQHAEKM